MNTTAKLVSAFAFATLTAGSQAVQLVANGDFQSSSIAPWTESSAFPIIDENLFGTLGTAGNRYAWLGGYANANDKLSQTVDFGSLAGTATLTFKFEAALRDEPTYDFFTVKIGSTTLDTIDLGAATFGAGIFSGVTTKSYDVSAFMGTGSQVLEFGTTTDVSFNSSALVDDVSIEATPVPEPATMTALALGLAAIARRRKSA
jgi:hypothetical protein